MPSPAAPVAHRSSRAAPLSVNSSTFSSQFTRRQRWVISIARADDDSARVCVDPLRPGVGGIYLSHLVKSTAGARVCALVPRSRYAASENRGRFAARGVNLAGAKLIVCFPHPKDAAAFEKAYTEVHLPMARPILARTGAQKA